MIDGLTEKQREVLDAVGELLTEHFDCHVVVVEVADANDQGDHLTLGTYNGGPAAAMGLCLYQLKQVERTLFDN